jgi:poly(glycerol-phosphate) alpha-glucosyltransferase
VNWCNNKIPNHHFFANLKKEQIPDWLHDKAGSILLITSRYEGFSLSLIEGMSQGLIPVTYPVGIAPEIIENGKNGFLIGTQSEGKKAIEHLLHLPKEDRHKMAVAAQETAQGFSSKTISKRLIEVYNETLKKRSK